MKALVVNSFEETCRPEVCHDVPKPQVHSKGILVKMHAVGVNSMDKAILRGRFNHVKVTTPFTPGLDGAGVVAEVGSDVTRFKPGDRVYTYSTKLGLVAEYALVNEDDVRPLPQQSTFQQGAVLPISYTAAYRAIVHRGKARAGETILIHGASGQVGLACCHIARAIGLRVIGTASTPEGMNLVKENGADFVFNHKAPHHVTQVLEATDGKGVNLIAETALTLNIEGDIKMLAPGGKILVIGRGPGQLQTNLEGLMPKEIELLGVSGLIRSTKMELEKAFEFIEKHVEGGTFVPVVGKQYSLDRAADAIENLGKPNGILGKQIINICQD